MTVAWLASTEPSSDASPSARALARHASWNYGALVLQLGSSLAIYALAFRHLPGTDVGAFALTAATVGLVQILDPAAGYVMSRVVAERDVGRTADEQVLPDVRAGLNTVAYGLAGVTGLGVVLALVLGIPALGPPRLMMVAGVALAACVQLASAALPATALGLGDYRGLCEASALTAAVTLTLAWLLLPPTGVAALGIALVAGQVSGRGLLFVRLRHDSRSMPASARPLGLAAVGELWRHSCAIYLSSLAAQLLAVSDLWTVGALRGVGSTAAYRGGSMIPTQASSLFYRVYDVLYPRLPRMREAASQERAIALASRVFCAGAGCMFTALFLERGPFTHLLVGSTDPLTEHVFALFCAIWLVNVPVHGLALLLISRGKARVMTPVVLVEAAANIAVSIVLVVLVGPIGAAIGTLATMAVSNLIVMPWIIGRLISGAFRMTWLGAGCCLLGVGVGATLQTPAALGLHGLLGSATVAGAGLVSVVAAVWVAAGRHGRQVLRAHV
jgi:O-antigen/teichoic acid export membrane protein